MRRIQGLLLAAGLAAAPASATAEPSKTPTPPPATTYEYYAWSSSQGRLGALVMGLTPELRTHFGAGADRGVIVARVEPDTPAARSGLAVGDVIVDVRGHAIDDASDVVFAIADAKAGEDVTLQVVRDGHPVALHATMRDDAHAQLAPGPHDPRFDRWLRELGWPFDWERWFHEHQVRAPSGSPRT